MRKRIPIKDLQKETQLIARRTLLGVAVMGLLLALLILRLVSLQLVQHEVYITLSTKNWLDLVPQEPTRGLIYDRNGVLLAENISVYSLDIIPMQTPDLNNTINELKKIIDLNENDISQFKKQLKQHRRFDEIPLKLRLNEEEAARFAENQYRFPGVLVKARLMRHYPFGESFSHVLGYVGRINAQELASIDTINYSASHYIGKLGIEKFYEKDLHGEVGYQEVENDASGKAIRILNDIKAVPGKNIYLTIDSKLQLVAEKALAGRRGAVVAIDPKTGQVLTLVSQPSYDPNIFVTGINQANYQSLQQSEDKPLFNRALRGLYPLASTIKPFLALKALDEDKITTDYTIYDRGSFQLKNNNHLFHDWWQRGHGKVNVNKALISSCDVFFYDLASRVGIQFIDNVLMEFGFGSLTGIDLDEELAGVVASPQWKLKTKGVHWFDGDTIISSIGQGYMSATPLQLAAATATLANRGLRYMPYLRLGWQDHNGRYQAQSTMPLASVSIHDIRHWEVITDAMEKVVTSPQGTGFRFGRKHAYTLAAKTGTAQLFRRRIPDEENKQEDLPEKLRDHHLFIVFAPSRDPKIALAIVTENSNTAVETARTILDYYLTGNSNGY